METLKTQTVPAQTTSITKSFTKSIKFSIRMGHKVTSISLKKNVCSLWLLMNSPINPGYPKHPKNIILAFIHRLTQETQRNSAKGFSDFITEKMIEDILSKKDFNEYKRIKTRI